MLVAVFEEGASLREIIICTLAGISAAARGLPDSCGIEMRGGMVRVGIRCGSICLYLELSNCGRNGLHYVYYGAAGVYPYMSPCHYRPFISPAYTGLFFSIIVVYLLSAG